MDFDEYEYLEKTVENPEAPKGKESHNGVEESVKSSEKDRNRSSKHRSDDKDDEREHRSKRSKSGEESRDNDRRKERGSSGRDGERDRRRSSRERRDREDRDKDREERNGKERDREREREQDRDRDRERRERDREGDKEKDRDKERERERERSQRSRSHSERHRSEWDERERSRDTESRERDKDKEVRDRDRESRDVAFEIATLHQNKVIHGNINPHNIFVFRGKRLFAKLLDDGTSKWKAPEQLLNGSQTKASDMFNFGCVLFTCITKGGHPFGNTLDQCYDNIMENRKSLSRVKCYPEAFNLLSRMLNREPKLRPIAMEVLSHPLFWNSEKRLSFLKCCSKQIEYEIKQSNLELLEALESIAPIVMDEKWDEEIRTVRNSCGFKEVQSLLRFISETFSHYYSIPARISGYQEELQPLGDSLKPHYRILDEYFTGRYPWLLIYLYNLMLKHFRGMSWLSVYCLREYNQMHDFGNVYWDLGEQDEDDEYSDEEDKDEDEDEYSDEEDEDEDEVEDLGLGEENEDEDED